MTHSERWLLPDGVDELLPPSALKVEYQRRVLLNLYRNWGYDLVVPPLVEYLDSLLTGAGSDLDLQTFKLTDQLTGRMMGIRADMTPQAARIDAHLLAQENPDAASRLCYASTVLHTRPAHMLTNRCPLQVGCELFGESGSSADVEVICLMIESLRATNIDHIHIDLAHVGIYRALVAYADFDADLEDRLFDSVRRKSIPELDQLIAERSDSSQILTLIRDLVKCSGGIEMLQTIEHSVSGLDGELASQVMTCLDELRYLGDQVRQRYSHVELGFDFCELRGYNYHTGILFAAYTPGYGYSLAQGGRYDNVGRDFGIARPATGFSADLKVLASFINDDTAVQVGILAPAGDDPELLDKIAQLRKSQRVVQRLNDADDASYGCLQELVLNDGEWQLKELAR